MKKEMILKRMTAVSLAAIMAFTVYMPTAAFASEGSDDQATETTQEENTSEPAPKAEPAPAPKADPAPAPKAEPAPAPKAESSAPATQESSAPAAQESSAQDVQESSAPAAQESDAQDVQESETQDVQESEKAMEVSTQKINAASDAKAAPTTQSEEAKNVQEPEAAEESSPAAEKANYGEATGNWGYGNSTRTVRWDEYTIDGETTLVFTITGDSDIDEENAVTELLDSNGKSIKNALKNRVTRIVFENGITGIGWTYLYDGSNYQPLYSSDYTVDRNKTDLFNGFQKLTTVVPCESIKRIGWSAFRKCYNLNDFDFSKCPQLEEIMNQAFSDCKALNNVNLAACNALTTLAWSAFNGAGQGVNASITLPVESALSVIGGYAFYGYAKNNAAGAAVDFASVAVSVTQILVKAFDGSHILGTISGAKNLETVANDAFRNSYITYIPYEPGQDEESNEENNEEQNSSNDNDEQGGSNDNDEQGNNDNDEQGSNDNDEQGSNDNDEQEPGSDDDEVVVDDNSEVIADEEPKAVADEEPEAVSDEDNTLDAKTDSASQAAIASFAGSFDQVIASTAPAAAAESTASAANSTGVIGTAETAIPARAASSLGTTGLATALTAIESSTVPAAPSAADIAAISDADTPMANATDESSHGYLLGGMGLALAMLLSIAAIALIRRRADEK